MVWRHCLLPSGRVCFEERGEVRTQKKVCTCFGTADFQFSLMFVLNIIQLRLQSQQLCYQQQLQCQLFQQQLLQLFQL